MFYLIVWNIFGVKRKYGVQEKKKSGFKFISMIDPVIVETECRLESLNEYIEGFCFICNIDRDRILREQRYTPFKMKVDA